MVSLGSAEKVHDVNEVNHSYRFGPRIHCFPQKWRSRGKRLHVEVWSLRPPQGEVWGPNVTPALLSSRFLRPLIIVRWLQSEL